MEIIIKDIPNGLYLRKLQCDRAIYTITAHLLKAKTEEKRNLLRGMRDYWAIERHNVLCDIGNNDHLPDEEYANLLVY